MQALFVRTSIGVSPNLVLLEQHFKSVDWRSQLHIADLVGGYDVIILDGLRHQHEKVLGMVWNAQVHILIINAPPEVVDISEQIGGDSHIIIASEYDLDVALPRFLFLMKNVPGVENDGI